MTKMQVILSNGTVINMDNVENPEELATSVTNVLNDYSTFLLNFGGNVISKSLLWVMAPEYDGEDAIELKLTVTGTIIKLDPSKFDASQVTNDANDRDMNFIKVAGAVVPKSIVESIMPPVQ